LEHVVVKSFSENDVLIDKGDDQRRILILTDGVAKVEHEGSYFGLISDGDCLGETGFINGGAFKHRVTAITPVNALELSSSAMGELPPKIHLHYYRHISEILVSRSAQEKSQRIDVEL